MPAIFEFLYKEFCRARLVEMRKQLMLTGNHPELFLPDDDAAGPDGDDRTDAQRDIELKRAGK